MDLIQTSGRPTASSTAISTGRNHRRKLLLGPGAQAPPPTFMIMGLAYMTSPLHFCDVILSKLFQLFALVLRNADKSTVRPFIPCSARHFWKGAKFAGSVGHPMTKMLSASGGALPLDPAGGSAPRPPLYARAPHSPVTPSTAYDPRASSRPVILTSSRLCLQYFGSINTRRGAAL